VTDYRDWIGKSDETTDTLAISPAQRMAATLNRSDIFVPGATLPPLWHWLYFLPATRMDDIGADGHALRGGFLPPIDLPRRMWAGSRIVFHRPLHVGERALKKSTIANVTPKQGKSGALVFVLVRHEIIAEEGLAMLEEQDIVFREAASGAVAQSGQPAPAEAQWSKEITPSPMLLFRYSALTFNTHRIHYDRSYCTDVEGYPGLVVHGQLTATFLLEALREHTDRPLRNFGFKAISALYDTQPYHVEGRIDGDTAQLWALDQAGNLAMTATAGLG
jgi:3-methylfumaryl-CoA hydratase